MSTREKNKKTVKIEIPFTLAKRLKKKVEIQGFKNLSEYINYILRKNISLEKETSSLGLKEEKTIKQRLKSLGYIE